MCGLNHLLIRKLPQEPSREEVTRKLTLRVTERHVDDQPLAFPIGHTLESICHQSVMLAFDKGWPHLFYKMNEVCLGFGPILKLTKVAGEKFDPFERLWVQFGQSCKI